MTAGIKFDKRLAKAINDLLSESPKWVSQAINDTVKGIKTDVIGDKIGVRRELNTKRKDVADLIQMIPAKPKKLEGIVRVEHKPIPAYDKSKPWRVKDQKPGLNFSGRRSGRPRAKSKVTGKAMKGKAYKYSFKFKKNKGRQTFTNAFAATMKSGHTGIFIRTGPKKGAKRGGQRLKEIVSSSAVDVLKNKRINELILKAAEVRMTKRVQHQIERVLK